MDHQYCTLCDDGWHSSRLHPSRYLKRQNRLHAKDDVHDNAWKAVVSLDVVLRRPASQESALAKSLRMRACITCANAERGGLAQNIRLFRHLLPNLMGSMKMPWICEASVLGLRTEILRVQAHWNTELRSWSKPPSSVVHFGLSRDVSTRCLHSSIFTLVHICVDAKLVSNFLTGTKQACRRIAAGYWAAYPGSCRSRSLIDLWIC